jgi:hypothetical protein
MLTYQSPSKLAIAAARGRRKGNGPKAKLDLDENDGEAEVAVQEPIGKKQRYQLIQQKRYYGCFDAIDATVVLFASEREAMLHIRDLVCGRERAAFRQFYGGSHGSKL